MAPDSDRLVLGLWRQDLHDRLGWVIRLRWWAAIGLLTTVLLARFGIGLEPAIGPILVLNGVLVLSNAVFWHLWKRWEDASMRRLVRFGVAQTLSDFLILTMVLHYSGGVENPLIVTFVFQCIIASMLFTPALSYFLAAVAVILMGTTVALEQAGIWPHWHLAGYLSLELAQNGLYVWGVLVTLTVVLFTTVYLATTIETASRKRSREAEKRLVELECAREQIREADKMAALGELAASMAHDINNPAGVICSRLEVMEAEGALGSFPERLRKDFATLRECARYLRRVADNWTRFARKSPSVMGRVDLNEAARGTVAMVAESLANHGIELRLRFHQSPLWVHGDLVRLQQVVLNLLNNARDAMPGGGILTIHTRVESNPPAHERACLEVADTGEGIAPDDLDDIFKPLFSRKPAGQGTGLGLAICQKAVREMEGAIRVRSEIGRGTVFAVTLPLNERH